MQTLEEFLKDKTLPQEIDVTGPTSSAYTPYTVLKKDHVHQKYIAHDQKGTPFLIEFDARENWALYTPPKEKIKRWLWRSGRRMNLQLMTDKEAREYFLNLDIDNFQKLLWSETEAEAEDE